MCMDDPHRFLLKMCRNHLNNMTNMLIFIGESICNKNPPNLKIIDTVVFLWISVAFVMLITILNVYYFLTSGNGSFPRWRPRWLPGSHNS